MQFTREENYYLSIGKHMDGDDELRARRFFARKEFPFIAEQLVPLED